MTRKDKDNNEILASNRAAGHEFHLLQRIEAGIVLRGTEVKSARLGKVNIKEAFARVTKQGEVYLYGAHIAPYEQGNRANHEPLAPRKLLLHAREIRKLAKETISSGVTLVATKMYLTKGRIKIELVVAKGKKLHDKREASRLREIDQELARARGSRTPE